MSERSSSLLAYGYTNAPELGGVDINAIHHTQLDVDDDNDSGSDGAHHNGKRSGSPNDDDHPKKRRNRAGEAAWPSV